MPPRSRTWLGALLVAALAAAVFLPAAGNDFVNLDDNRFIFENAQVLRGLTAETARWALVSTEHANWYPLTRLSHLADASLFGMRAGWHHGVSALWHAAGAGVLFLALFGMTGARLRSLVVAGLFAVHPLQVESVAWASERSMVLAGFFFALALLLWGRYARRPGPGRYGAALGALALGLAAKPVGVTLPLVLLLLDYWPLGRLGTAGAPGRISGASLARCALEKAPLLALAAASSLATLLTQEEVGAMTGLGRLSPILRLGNALLAYVRYLGAMLWPADLAVYYPHPVHEFPAPAVVFAAAALLAGISAAAFALARRRPALVVGWLWYLGTLLPMIGVVQVGAQAFADRYVYLPIVGAALAAVWALGGAAGSARGRRIAAAACAAVVAVLAAASVAQVLRWRDSVTLFRHTLAVTEGNWLIEVNLGFALRESRRFEEAAVHFEKAIGLGPGLAAAHAGLAATLRDLGRPAEAAERYREVLRLVPDNPLAWNDLGNVLFELGRSAEAEASYREAVRLDPGVAEAQNNLGFVLAGRGAAAEAEARYREALRLAPELRDAHENLGELLMALGRTAEAAPHLREAERLRLPR